MSEFMAGATVPAIKLEAEQAENYAQRMPRIMRAARLNNYYPNAGLLGGHIGVMSPSVHRGLNDAVEVDERTGIPTYKAFTRVQSDAAVAPSQIQQLGSREVLQAKAERDPGGIYAKQLAKFDYYSALLKADQTPLGQMEVRFRKEEQRRNYFHVTLDKLDVSGLFVRYTIDCSQEVGAGESIASVDAREVAEHTDAFRSLIYQFTSLDAEFTLVKLASMAGLQVERVVKGTVGPFFFPDITTIPQPLQHVIQGQVFVASFGLDMAAIDVLEDKNNDPFSSFAIKTLSDEAAAGYKVARQRLGYHVYKDRKCVCRRQDVAALRAALTELGTNNIVYGV